MACAPDRVSWLVDDIHLAAGRHEDGLQRGAGNPEHRIQCDLQVGSADGIHVHLVDDRVDVAVERIDLADQSPRNGLLVGQPEVLDGPHVQARAMSSA